MAANQKSLKNLQIPQLPVAPVQWNNRFMDQYTKDLRMYFAQIASFSAEVSNSLAYPQTPGPPIPFFLTTVGDGSGTSNLAQDFSGGATTVHYTVTTGIFYVYNVVLTIVGNNNFKYNDFGSIAGGVTNGITLFYTPSGQPAIPLLTGLAFKQNYQFFSVTPHLTISSFAGLSQVLTADFLLFTDYGVPLVLNTGDKFSCVLHDNFSSLISFTILLQGIRIF